jgi:hypothetical protein
MLVLSQMVEVARIAKRWPMAFVIMVIDGWMDGWMDEDEKYFVSFPFVLFSTVETPAF